MPEEAVLEQEVVEQVDDAGAVEPEIEQTNAGAPKEPVTPETATEAGDAPEPEPEKTPEPPAIDPTDAKVIEELYAEMKRLDEAAAKPLAETDDPLVKELAELRKEQAQIRRAQVQMEIRQKQAEQRTKMDAVFAAKHPDWKDIGPLAWELAAKMPGAKDDDIIEFARFKAQQGKKPMKAAQSMKSVEQAAQSARRAASEKPTSQGRSASRTYEKTRDAAEDAWRELGLPD